MDFNLTSLTDFWSRSFGGVDLYSHPFFIIDVILVSVIFYYLYAWSRKTRIIPIISGLIILGISFLVARTLDLTALEWILDKVLTMLVIAIPIVFSDEIKRFLEKLGQTKLFRGKNKIIFDRNWIDEIVDCVAYLKEIRCGALLVLEKETLLTEYIEDSKTINANVSTDLLISIFNNKSPLHDGAVIIRNGKIAAAKCILPISREFIEGVGTRHRAALGMSHKSDAIIIVNSEENGEISVAESSILKRNINKVDLHNMLINAFEKSHEKKSLIKKILHV